MADTDIKLEVNPLEGRVLRQGGAGHAGAGLPRPTAEVHILPSDSHATQTQGGVSEHDLGRVGPTLKKVAGSMKDAARSSPPETVKIDWGGHKVAAGGGGDGSPPASESTPVNAPKAAGGMGEATPASTPINNAASPSSAQQAPAAGGTPASGGETSTVEAPARLGVAPAEPAPITPEPVEAVPSAKGGGPGGGAASLLGKALFVLGAGKVTYDTVQSTRKDGVEAGLDTASRGGFELGTVGLIGAGVTTAVVAVTGAPVLLVGGAVLAVGYVAREPIHRASTAVMDGVNAVGRAGGNWIGEKVYGVKDGPEPMQGNVSTDEAIQRGQARAQDPKSQTALIDERDAQGKERFAHLKGAIEQYNQEIKQGTRSGAAIDDPSHISQAQADQLVQLMKEQIATQEANKGYSFNPWARSKNAAIDETIKGINEGREELVGFLNIQNVQVAAERAAAAQKARQQALPERQTMQGQQVAMAPTAGYSGPAATPRAPAPAQGVSGPGQA